MKCVVTVVPNLLLVAGLLLVSDAIKANDGSSLTGLENIPFRTSSDFSLSATATVSDPRLLNCPQTQRRLLHPERDRLYWLCESNGKRQFVETDRTGGRLARLAFPALGRMRNLRIQDWLVVEPNTGTVVVRTRRQDTDTVWRRGHRAIRTNLRNMWPLKFGGMGTAETASGNPVLARMSYARPEQNRPFPKAVRDLGALPFLGPPAGIRGRKVILIQFDAQCPNNGPRAWLFDFRSGRGTGLSDLGCRNPASTYVADSKREYHYLTDNAIGRNFALIQTRRGWRLRNIGTGIIIQAYDGKVMFRENGRCIVRDRRGTGRVKFNHPCDSGAMSPHGIFAYDLSSNSIFSARLN